MTHSRLWAMSLLVAPFWARDEGCSSHHATQDLRPVRRGVTSGQGRWPCRGLRPRELNKVIKRIKPQ